MGGYRAKYKQTVIAHNERCRHRNGSCRNVTTTKEKCFVTLFIKMFLKNVTQLLVRYGSVHFLRPVTFLNICSVN